MSQHCSSKVFSIEQMCRYRTVIWPVAERETSAETWNSCTAMISLGFHYEACNEADKMDFEKAIETIAVAFSSKWVSDISWLCQTANHLFNSECGNHKQCHYWHKHKKYRLSLPRDWKAWLCVCVCVRARMHVCMHTTCVWELKREVQRWWHICMRHSWKQEVVFFSSRLCDTKNK